MAGGQKGLGLGLAEVRITSTVAIRVLVGILWLVGCRPPTRPQTPPPPAGITDPASPAQRTAVLNYARSLKYDTSHGAYDRNLLDSTGAVGTVWAEENIHRTPPSTLDSGRIQLRIVVTSARPLRGRWDYLPRDTSYVWVDRRGVYARHPDTARAVIIPVDPADSVRILRVVVHREPEWNRAMARWTPGQCWNCQTGSWCWSGGYN
jgi:hypothetical protein